MHYVVPEMDTQEKYEKELKERYSHHIEGMVPHRKIKRAMYEVDSEGSHKF